jgi:IS1 family transposase
VANVLPMEKKVAVVSALAEGVAIRAVERMTGAHRDTIMRLGVHVGQGCSALMDQKMRGLDCSSLQLDEIWGFIQKKQGHRKPGDPEERGDAWTFVAIDADTKVVPCYHVGRRTGPDAETFLVDLSSRLANRVQLSTDSLAAYVKAVEAGFGHDVDYGTIVKTYASDERYPEGKYSPPEVVSVERAVVCGKPDEYRISTSYVERQNLTMRMHMRRLTRLTNAFSKRLENFKAAVGLHFGYYNFVKVHRTIKDTPAVAAGVADRQWTVAELIEMAD